MQQHYYCLIPVELVQEGDATKALVYGILSSLATAKGFCWPNNKFIAKKVGRKDVSIISRHLDSLEKEGWIYREYNEKGNKRIIWMFRQIPQGVLEKTQGGLGKNPVRVLEKTQYRESIINRVLKKNNGKVPLEDLRKVVDYYIEQKYHQQASKEVIKATYTEESRVAKQLILLYGVDSVLEAIYWTADEAYRRQFDGWKLTTVKKWMPDFFAYKEA